MGTLRRFVDRIVRLYEQDADMVSIGQYVRRWRKWAVAGIRTLVRDESDFFRADIKKAGAVIPLPSLSKSVKKILYAFFLRLLSPARPIKPVPKRSMVDGSGTGLRRSNSWFPYVSE